MALEIRLSKQVDYDPFKADVFSLGVCLLYFLTGHRISDVRTLQYVYEEKWQEFWELLQPQSELVSDSLRTFIQSMLQKDALQRPSLEEILVSDFFISFDT